MTPIDRWFPLVTSLGGWAYALLFGFAFGESIAVIGLLIPGATFMVIFGFVIAHHVLDFETAAILAALGAILGDLLSFILGRRGVDPAKKFPSLFSQETIDRAEKFMQSHGVTGIFLGRFIGPLRPFVPFVAGALKMRWQSFMVMNITSGILWSLSYLALGYFFGQFWSSIHRGMQWVGIGLVVIVLGFVGFQMLEVSRSRKE